MKTLTFAIAVVLGLAALPAHAERPTTTPMAAETSISPGELTATPEMWFYQQSVRQYLDPKLAVRRKAEFAAQSRQNRIAAMKWFGYSNARPRVNTDLLHNDYAPGWTGNNDWYPDRWVGVGQPYILVRPEK